MISFAIEQLEELQNRLAQDVASGLIPGATIVVGRHDEIVFQRSVGFRDAAKGDPLRPDSIWRIFSMTKPIVTVAAMVLIERGLLRLDQEVAEIISSFETLHIAGPDGTSQARNRPTVQDLMRHTAGLTYGYLGEGPAHRACVADGLLSADLPLAEFVDRLAALPLEHEPGTVWHYSHATDVLGRVVEVITGKTLRAALQALLLEPLRMKDTDFQVSDQERGRMAEALPLPYGARPSFFDPCLPRRHQSAGGGLVSTAGDYARFLRMLLGRGVLDGQYILGPLTLKQMTVDQLGPGIRKASYYPPGAGYGFGLGFAVRTAEGEAPFPGSRGDFFWSGVGGTYFWVDPVCGFFALFMVQTSSAKQRQHYRSMTRNMIYAAIRQVP
jgi:CubicO group peptidase (beta-lactamase class C family)